MKNNKILMSLVLASISAMSAAPSFMAEQKKDKKKEANNNSNTDPTSIVAEGRKMIDVNSIKTAQMDGALKDDFTKQMDAMLMKKSSIQQLSESVSVLVDNYGQNDQSLRDEIYKELNFAQAAGTQDSTNNTASGQSTQMGGGGTTSNAVVYCHSACHSACHAACHGARGWR